LNWQQHLDATPYSLGLKDDASKALPPGQDVHTFDPADEA
jgi:hypothetical protein